MEWKTERHRLESQQHSTSFNRWIHTIPSSHCVLNLQAATMQLNKVSRQKHRTRRQISSWWTWWMISKAWVTSRPGQIWRGWWSLCQVLSSGMNDIMYAYLVQERRASRRKEMKHVHRWILISFPFPFLLSSISAKEGAGWKWCCNGRCGWFCLRRELCSQGLCWSR